LVLGLPTGNYGAVPLIDSRVWVAKSVVVFKALNWLIVLTEGKRVFVPGLNPPALFPSLMVKKGEGVGHKAGGRLAQLEVCDARNGLSLGATNVAPQ
jgi:hypothetical protein